MTLNDATLPTNRAATTGPNRGTSSSSAMRQEAGEAPRQPPTGHRGGATGAAPRVTTAPKACTHRRRRKTRGSTSPASKTASSKEWRRVDGTQWPELGASTTLSLFVRLQCRLSPTIEEVPHRVRFHWLNQVTSRSDWTTSLRRQARARAETTGAALKFTVRD